MPSAFRGGSGPEHDDIWRRFYAVFGSVRESGESSGPAAVFPDAELAALDTECFFSNLLRAKSGCFFLSFFLY
jgi:hypothetical protein